ncbi:hypothetical protein [Streptomyces niveus]
MPALRSPPHGDSRHLKEAAECYHPIDPAAAAVVRQDLRML